ncbi:MAG: methyltransferase domain-containing protein [Candidatus Zixiibacteriota bacterium]
MLYDYPEYYEIAFGFRDFAREAGFLHDCISRYSEIPVRDVFEVACGPAPHCDELTRRGYRYTGLDINRNMVDFAAYKWRLLSPRPEFVEGDMVRFGYSRKIDFAFVMLGSLYFNTQKEMHLHFDSLSNILNPGGLYFLDWCVQFSDPMAQGTSNSFAIEKDGIAVRSEFNIRLVDSIQQMYEEVWRVKVDDGGRHKEFEMVERNRAILPAEFMRFVEQRRDFDFVGWWADWDFGKPIGVETDAVRPVVLLRRTAY